MTPDVLTSLAMSTRSGLWNDWLLPRLIDFGLDNKVIRAERKKALQAVHGTVLELGFGSGLNLPYYPPETTKVVGVDPSGEAAKLARHRIEAAKFPVEYLELEGERLKAEPATFDTAVSTLTLCTIPDPVAALRQVKDALKPGGTFHFLEHGLAPEKNVQRWQERWDPIQGKLFGGCSVKRPIKDLVEQAGFEILSLETYYTPGPKMLGYTYRGVARRM